MSSCQEKHSKYINVVLKASDDLEKVENVIIAMGDFDINDYDPVDNAQILKTMTFEEFSGWIEDKNGILPVYKTTPTISEHKTLKST